MPSRFGLIATLTLLPGILRAQATTAVLLGIVTDDSSRAPLPGVEVIVERDGRRAETGSDGLYRLDGVRAGISVVLFRLVGYRPVRMRAILQGGDTVRYPVAMARAAMQLEPIEVVASSYPHGMEAYADRKSRGFGRFFDPPELRKQEHRPVSEVLRTVAGVRPVKVRRGGRDILVISSARGGGLGRASCPMAIWVDGIRVYEPRAGSGPANDPPDINQWTVRGLEAMEIYRGPAETPAQLAGTGAQCGTIVLWTRKR
jgi:hypothetical protein